MGNKITKELGQRLLTQEQLFNKIETGYAKEYIEEDRMPIRKNLIKILKEEKGGMSLSHSSKKQKIKELMAKRLGMRIDIQYIKSSFKEIDINRANPNINSERQEIQKEFTIESNQLTGATKHIGKKIESGEDIVTLKDLQELEKMMDDTKQKIDTIVKDIKEYGSL